MTTEGKLRNENELGELVLGGCTELTANKLEPVTREMLMLDQVEDLLIHCERAPKENTPTMKAFIILARVVYYLLRERYKEKHWGKQDERHDPAGGKS